MSAGTRRRDCRRSRPRVRSRCRPAMNGRPERFADDRQVLAAFELGRVAERAGWVSVLQLIDELEHHPRAVDAVYEYVLYLLGRGGAQ